MTAAKKILVPPVAGPPPSDFTGNYLFTQTSSDAALGGVAFDSTDIYTAGYFRNSAATGVSCLHKFGTDLTLKDTFIFADAVTGFAVAGIYRVAENSNGVYVFGSARTATSSYGLVTRHDKSTLAIDAHFAGIVQHGSICKAGALASDGSVYVAIDASQVESSNAYTIIFKLSADLSTIVWRKKLFDQALTGTTIKDMFVDSNGDLVVCGMAGLSFAFAGRFNATNGALSNYLRFDFTTSQNVQLTSILEHSGSLYGLYQPFSGLMQINFDLSGWGLQKSNYFASSTIEEIKLINGNFYCAGLHNNYNPNRDAATVWTVDPSTLLANSDNALVVYENAADNSKFQDIVDLGDGRFVCVGYLGHAQSGFRNASQIVCCFDYDITTLQNSGVCNTQVVVGDDLSWTSDDRTLTDQSITLTVSDDTTGLNTGNPVETTETYTPSGPCSWDGT